MEKSGTTFKLLLILFGTSSILYALIRLLPQPLDPRWVVLSLIAMIIGQIVASRIPGAGNVVTISDTFIFLAVILCGPEAGVMVAAVASVSDSARYATRRFTIATNVAMISFSVMAACLLTQLIFGDLRLLSHNRETFFAYIAGLGVLAVSHGLINTLCLARIVAFRTREPVLSIWQKEYCWVLITHVIGIVMAGAVNALIHYYGFVAVTMIVPLLAANYLAARPYLRNLESAHRHLAELQHSEERFRSAFDYSSIGMALMESEGRIVQVNPSLCRITGYEEAELLGMNYHSLIHPDDLGQALVQVHRIRAGQLPSFDTETRFLHKQGDSIWGHWNVSLAHDPQTKSALLVFQVQDVSARRCAEEKLWYDAFHDSLTNLPNRALFLDRLKQALETHQTTKDRFLAVLSLDLDRFKIINDCLGHTTGDHLLNDITQRLTSFLWPGSTLARLGGDEFVILLENLTRPEEAVEFAIKVHRVMGRPFNLKGQDIFMTASIGIADSRLDYEKAEDMLRDADTAMYRAKSAGTARHEVFDRDMHARVADRLQLETELRRAIEREEFFLQYQPIVDLLDGRLRGFEALVRWRHPEQGLISPARFIPIAEENGLIVPLGEWVLRQACCQLREWQTRHPEASAALQISVNLSGRQFVEADLLERIRRCLRETELQPQCLKLELTESVVMENVEVAIHLLRQIRDLGIELSVDDFGTGYSSLSYLHRFPLNTLKVDRSFVVQMLENNENKELVRTVVMLARNLRMDVIAEGVEELEQWNELRTLGCRYGQGYYFSRPVNAEEAERLIGEPVPWLRSFIHLTSSLLPEGSEKVAVTSAV